MRRRRPLLAADGVFDAEGAFTVLPPIPRKVLEPWFRTEVLVLLRREGLVSEALAEKMLAWRYIGFSAHKGRHSMKRPAGSLELIFLRLCSRLKLELITICMTHSGQFGNIVRATSRSPKKTRNSSAYWSLMSRTVAFNRAPRQNSIGTTLNVICPK